MWLLLLPTLGLGTAALWLWSLRWPQAVEDDGIRLRSGRHLPWEAIKGLGVIKHRFDTGLSRVDIHFDGGIARVPMRFIANGEAVAREIRNHLPHLKRH